MKYLVNQYTIIVLVLVFLATSCNKDLVDNEKNIAIGSINGIDLDGDRLHFRSIGKFTDFYHQLMVEDEDAVLIVNQIPHDGDCKISEALLCQIVNNHGEFIIGTVGFKVFSNNEILMLADAESKAFERYRGMTSNEIQRSHNVRKVGLYDDSTILYETLENGTKIERDVADLDFTIVDKDGAFTVVNTSFVLLQNNRDASYVWKVNGKSASTVTHPDISLREGDLVSLELHSNGQVIDVISKSIDDQAGVRDALCDHLITEQQIGECEFKIEIHIPWGDKIGYGSVLWELPDGTKLGGTNSASGNFIEIEPDCKGQDWYSIRVSLFSTTGELICYRYHHMACPLCECGETASNEKFINPIEIDGDTYRARIEIWCTQFFWVSSVGSLTRVQKQGLLGVWAKTSVDEVAASFKGILQDNDYLDCPDIIIPYHEEIEYDAGHIERNVNTDSSKPRVLENMNKCESTHWFKHKGVYAEYPGKLFLN